MKQIDCSGLDIRDDSGKVLVDSIVDLIFGQEITGRRLCVSQIVISLPILSAIKIGQFVTVWNKNESKAVYRFIVEGTQNEFQERAHKIDGRVFTIISE